MRRSSSVFASLSLVLLLAACSSSSTKTQAVCVSRYWDGTVGTCLPQSWHVVDSDVLRERGLPGEVIAAFQSDQAVSGQFPTVTVTRQALTKNVTSPEYSDASIASVATLPGYAAIDTKQVTVEGQQVKLHIYSAQLQPDQPKQRFEQVSAVSGNNGYTFTAALPLSVETTFEQNVQLILSNAAFHDIAQVGASSK